MGAVYISRSLLKTAIQTKKKLKKIKIKNKIKYMYIMLPINLLRNFLHINKQYNEKKLNPSHVGACRYPPQSIKFLPMQIQLDNLAQ